MNKEQQENEKKLADELAPLIKEINELELKKRAGVTLDKGEYIGNRQKDIETEVGQLKSKHNNQ